MRHPAASRRSSGGLSLLQGRRTGRKQEKANISIHHRSSGSDRTDIELGDDFKAQELGYLAERKRGKKVFFLSAYPRN